MPFRHVAQSSSRRLVATGVATASAVALLVPAVGSTVATDGTAEAPVTAAAARVSPADAPTSLVAVSRQVVVPPSGERPLIKAHVAAATAEEVQEAPAPEPEPTTPEPEPTTPEPEPEPTPTATPEPEQEPESSECPANSSPDCTYTYRHSISTWERLARCESGGDWSINTGNGYYGGVQFSLSSWQAVGGPGHPHENSKWTQIHFAERLQARQGWSAWPACSRKLGLR